MAGEVDGFRSDGVFGDEIAHERKLRIWAIPVSLLLAGLFRASNFGQQIQRVFLSMIVHELGHAVSAWLCGFGAIPIVWKTLIPEERGLVGSAIVLAAVVALGRRGLNEKKNGYLYLAGAIALAGVFCTFGLSLSSAQALVIFGGDGCGMILGTALMLSFYAPADTDRVKGWLRWGLLVIGSAAYVDMAGSWWIARHDWSKIPLGEMDGTPTDPSQLIDHYGWSMNALVSRYLWLAAACLAVLFVGWVYGLWSMRLENREGADV